MQEKDFPKGNQVRTEIIKVDPDAVLTATLKGRRDSWTQRQAHRIKPREDYL